MLISVHIQKTAGRAFGRYLEAAWPGQVFYDYGLLEKDTSPEIIGLVDKWRFDPAPEVFEDHCARHGIGVIHGHTFPRFYAELAPSADFAVWLRDPVDRVVSEYNYMRRIEHKGEEAYEKAFRREITLAEYAEFDRQRNFQAKQLQGVSLERFAFVGLVEDFDGSLDRFDGRFGLSGIERPGWVNVNAHQIEPDAALRDHIRALNEKDVALYNSALAMIGDTATGRAIRPTLPADFDAEAYLGANPDVAAAGHDPITHYLNHGYRENRRWQ